MAKCCFPFVFLFCVALFSYPIYGQEDVDFFGVNTVVIDPGHGGKDPGCHGSFSNEKDIALSISLMLGKYIEENFPDVNVIYTRKTDIYPELWERANIANKAKADLFICIHANSAKNLEAHGTETFVMGLSSSARNLEVAKRENASILLEDNYEEKYEGFDPNSTETYVALALMQNAFIEQSLNFAAKIQYQFRERVGRKDRGVKQAVLLVLHQTAMPSVLIETGFLTNKSEEEFLNSKEGQDYMASAIYRAFKSYKQEIEEKTLVTEEAEEVTVPVSEPQKKDKTTDKKEKKRAKNEEGIFFKVQIATSSEKKKLEASNFNGVEGVQLYESGGLYRYVVGAKRSMGEANVLQLRLREKGFQDAFIVAFKDGNRIPISEALSKPKE